VLRQILAFYGNNNNHKRNLIDHNGVDGFAWKLEVGSWKLEVGSWELGVVGNFVMADLMFFQRRWG
jgi:hypothetical protein